MTAQGRSARVALLSLPRDLMAVLPAGFAVTMPYLPVPRLPAGHASAYGIPPGTAPAASFQLAERGGNFMDVHDYHDYRYNN